MKIVVIGANGNVGSRVVDAALAAGTEVVAYVRRPETVTAKPGLTVTAGDATDVAALTAAARGAQAVVVDDYDRQTDEGMSLAFIRDLRATARLVVFTANDRKAFSGAELRPKRFDKIVRVDRLDRTTAQSIAPDLPEAVRQSGANGVLVKDVARGSRAAQNRLQPGDLILGTSAGQFSDLDGFRASFENKPAQLVVQVRRGNGRGNFLME